VFTVSQSVPGCGEVDNVSVQTLETVAWQEEPDEGPRESAEWQPETVRPAVAAVVEWTPRSPRPSLSQREVEVLIAWFAAESKTAAGRALFINPSTVATHISRVRAKYDAVGRRASSKSALFARLLEDGHTRLEDW
jgi:DNA-binding CsgD family transcriptional regulator